MGKMKELCASLAAAFVVIVMVLGCPQTEYIDPEIRISPNTAIVPVGETYSFDASISGIPSAYQSLVWLIVEGGTHSDTYVIDGVLRVAIDEKRESFTVRAALEADPAVFGEATVSVQAGDPEVLAVEVAPPEFNMASGVTGSVQFMGNVIGIHSPPRTLTWSIVETGTHSDTGIVGGLLTVSSAETLTRLTVRAISTFDPDVWGEAVVYVDPAPSDLLVVASGVQHTVAIASDGSLWAWGNNEHGRTGLSVSDGNTAAPTRIGRDGGWVYVSAGEEHTMAIREDGSLWAWGNNANGRTGLETTGGITLSPTRVGEDNNWRSVSAGTQHTMAIRTDNTLWATGNVANGRTGLLNQNVTGSISSFMQSVSGWGPGLTGTEWLSVSAGDQHTMGIRTDGTLWATGNVADGRTGLLNANVVGTISSFTQSVSGWGPGLTGTEWLSVSAGTLHSAGIMADGTLWAWGNNSNGRTGLGTTTGQANSPTQIGLDDNWKSVSAADQHSAGIRADGTLWAWGNNADGRTGLGTTADSQSDPAQVGLADTWAFVSAGAQHGMAIASDGTLWAWGNNADGRTGLGTTAGSQNTPVRLGR